MSDSSTSITTHGVKVSAHARDGSIMVNDQYKILHIGPQQGPVHSCVRRIIVNDVASMWAALRGPLPTQQGVYISFDNEKTCYFIKTVGMQHCPEKVTIKVV